MEGKIKKAMVLAAGYGTRLKPWTDRLPKPLVPVAGKPMIEYALDHLRAYGIEEIIINVSHLKDQLLDYAAGLREVVIRVSEEAEPLETGGGLKKALPLLGNDPFFTLNSDILWQDAEVPALERLARAWNDANMDFLLLTQPRARAVGYDQGQDHLFVRRDNSLEWKEAEAPYIIASVGIIHPRVLATAPEGKFSIKFLWQQALSQGRLFCLPHHGRWWQSGKIEDIRRYEVELAAASPSLA